jgi:putative transposase
MFSENAYSGTAEFICNSLPPYHDVQAESFLKTLKVEEVYRAGYETFADVTARLQMFIEQVYNSKRLHSALGYRTPEEFETLFAQKEA